MAGGLNPGYTPDPINPNTNLSPLPNLRFSFIVNNNFGKLINLPNHLPKKKTTYKITVGPVE